MNNPTILTAPAFAKINLFLDVTGRRADGYHSLDTVFCTVDLADEVRIELPRDTTGISVSMEPGGHVRERDNLAWRAAELLLPRQYGVRIEIKKQIPMAAGLGGGSADAACVLRLLNQALGRPLGADKLSELALRLGADVPFLLRGGGAARGQSLGERLRSLPEMPPCAILLVNTGERVSTAGAFAGWDRAAGTVEPRSSDGIIAGLRNADIAMIGKSLYNVFEEISLPACPLTADVLRELRADRLAAGACMSGSGATVYALYAGADAGHAERLAEEYRGRGYFAQTVKAVSIIA